MSKAILAYSCKCSSTPLGVQTTEKGTKHTELSDSTNHCTIFKKTVIRLEAIASRLEAMAIRFLLLLGWRPSLVKGNLVYETSVLRTFKNCSYTTHQYTTHHTPLIIHHSSYTTYHTPLIIHHSSYTTHHTPFIIHHSSYATYQYTNHHTPLITHHSSIHHSSYTTHQYTTHHTPLVIHHS